MTATITNFPRRAKGSGVAFEPPPSRADKPYRRETASEIAARIRSGMGPTRPIVERSLTRPKDGRELWI